MVGKKPLESRFFRSGSCSWAFFSSMFTWKTPSARSMEVNSKFSRINSGNRNWMMGKKLSKTTRFD
ncbi:hypothetical protein HMF3257_33735 [Spirosoma telluris]|uniref:Nuclease associated modular domain-containing protein n=1 Tax=Spirosoma telluris TaxID=2183553 RepID=A0A327NT08_9BACT|nr:hypothetical protein HMF3257_33735 [Spirosoma telluris]